MKGLKVYTRTNTIWSVVLYVFLTFLFTYVVDCLGIGQTAIDKNSFLKFLYLNFYLLFFMFVLSLSICFFKSIAKYLFLALYLYIGFKISFQLFADFNKLIFISLFIFFVFSYYFYILLHQEFNRPYYMPNMSLEGIDLVPIFNIDVLVRYRGEEEWHKGILTNWDLDSCFILFKKSNFSHKRYLEVKINFNGQDFVNLAKVYSNYQDLGIGVRFIEQKENEKLNWESLYQVLSEYGHHPLEMK